MGKTGWQVSLTPCRSTAGDDAIHPGERPWGREWVHCTLSVMEESDQIWIYCVSLLRDRPAVRSCPLWPAARLHRAAGLGLVRSWAPAATSGPTCSILVTPSSAYYLFFSRFWTLPLFLSLHSSPNPTGDIRETTEMSYMWNAVSDFYKQAVVSLQHHALGFHSPQLAANPQRQPPITGISLMGQGCV